MRPCIHFVVDVLTDLEETFNENIFQYVHALLLQQIIIIT